MLGHPRDGAENWYRISTRVEKFLGKTREQNRDKVKGVEVWIVTTIQLRVGAWNLEKKSMLKPLIVKLNSKSKGGTNENWGNIDLEILKRLQRS